MKDNFQINDTSIPEDDIADMEFELSEIADKDGKGLDSWKGDI